MPIKATKNMFNFKLCSFAQSVSMNASLHDNGETIFIYRNAQETFEPSQVIIRSNAKETLNPHYTYLHIMNGLHHLTLLYTFHIFKCRFMQRKFWHSFFLTPPLYEVFLGVEPICQIPLLPYGLNKHIEFNKKCNSPKTCQVVLASLKP